MTPALRKAPARGLAFFYGIFRDFQIQFGYNRSI